jgi:hypothetical protein
LARQGAAWRGAARQGKARHGKANDQAGATAMTERISADKAAENIKNKIEELSEEVAERFDMIDPKDWLNENFRRMQIKRVVREVLIDFLMGARR